MRDLFLKVYQFSLVLVVVTIPLERHSNGIALAIMIGSWIIYFLTKPQVVLNLKKNTSAILLLLFWIIYVVSLLYSEDLSEGWRNIERRLAFLIMPVVLTALLDLPKSFVSKLKWYYVNGVLAAVLLTLAIAVARTAVTGTVDYLNPESTLIENNFFYHRLSQGIGLLSSYFGFYISLAAGIVLSNLLLQRNTMSSKKLLFHLFRFGLFAAYIVLLKTAMIMMAFGIMVSFIVVYALFTTISGKKFKMAASAFLAILAVASSIVVVNKVGSSKHIVEYDIRGVPPDHDWNSVNLRLAKWKVTMDAISDHAILGVGIGDSKQVLLDYYLKHNFLFAYLKRYNPHNQYLATMLALGLPGLLILIGLLAYSGLIAWKTKDLPFISFLVLFACFAITEVALASNKAIVPFSFFLCYFSYSYVINTENDPGGDSEASRTNPLLQ